ncbi:peptidyl-prolyl cis-trans isomerase [Pseudoxanthomonas daejeonensis]|uniref:Periplasmic chaperone PpiD n=1 Tax=Pseudoxanthomonas daejeonensis TaxID=266062 RepID=A0ABQ6Z3B0_9GAMM|nr:peptidyl-prolyl cis-trans isomerase [Pseudoxanthomonas daejeonensis]KAF1691935.1 peptidylprolyl isomerase [Pseudoxanthomonas daejeonensis]UNK57780.1 peptidyl-prolyl cis-trans isomerase [Pseudoxanthomonas daejeonensis]
MLQKLRDRTSGWVATIIIALLMVPFLFVIDQRYMGGMGANNVAQVKAPPTWWEGAPKWWPASTLWEHREVGVDEFRQRFEQERMRVRQEQGEAFDPRAFETVENKRKVLDQLVDEKALQLAAERAGVVVGDAAVRDYIASIPAFQVEGKFDANRYQLALASQVPAQTPTQFELLVRDSLQQSLIPVGLGTSAFVTDAEFDRILRLSGEKRDVELALLPEVPEDTAAVDEAQIQAWYDAHPADFVRPESVTIEYVEVDGNSLPPAVPADEATLRKRYEDEKARFVEPEQRLASHILIRVEPDADAAALKAAEEKAQRLTAEAKAPGADFAALAKASSEDPGSRDSGGDLGWVERGAMVAPFEEALFSMQSGEVRGPVKTDFGFHVLQLRELKQGAQVSFEEAREELAREQAQVDRERAFSDLTGRLTDLVYQNPSSLAPAAEQVGLQVQKLGPFTREDTIGIGASPEVKKAAFSEALIEDGTASDPIQLGPEHSVVIRVIEHAPEQPRPLAEVKDQVVAAIRVDRRQAAAGAAADALAKRVQAGETMADVAASVGAQVMPLPGLPRGVPAPSPEANREIFAVAPPAEGKVAAGHFEMPDGRLALFAVTGVHPGDVAELQPEQREQLRKQFAQIDGAAAAEAYVRQIRKSFDIVIEESQL